MNSSKILTDKKNQHKKVEYLQQKCCQSLTFSRTVYQSMHGNMASRSAPWMYPCSAGEDRTYRQNALGDTSCTLQSHIDLWLAVHKQNTASCGVRESASHNTWHHSAHKNQSHQMGDDIPNKQNMITWCATTQIL